METTFNNLITQLFNLSPSTINTIKNALENELLLKLQNSPNPIISLYNGDVKVWIDELFDESTMEITSHIRIEVYDESLTKSPQWDVIILLDAISQI